jgi:hypothetical protein
MVVFLVVLALLALFVGALAFVTTPVGMTLAAVIAAWLVVYAVRGAIAKKGAQHRG